MIYIHLRYFSSEGGRLQGEGALTDKFNAPWLSIAELLGSIDVISTPLALIGEELLLVDRSRLLCERLIGGLCRMILDGECEWVEMALADLSVSSREDSRLSMEGLVSVLEEVAGGSGEVICLSLTSWWSGAWVTPSPPPTIGMKRFSSDGLDRIWFDKDAAVASLACFSLNPWW